LIIDSVDVLFLHRTKLSESRQFGCNVSLGDLSCSHAPDDVASLFFFQFENIETVFFDFVEHYRHNIPTRSVGLHSSEQTSSAHLITNKKSPRTSSDQSTYNQSLSLSHPI
jgi:hypothetical protein